MLESNTVFFQVVILSSKPFPTMSQSSVSEMTFESERKRKTLSDTSTMSNTDGSYSSLEDVQVRQKVFLTPSFIRGGIIKTFLLSLQEDDEYEKGESLIDTNGEEENKSDEKILISKHVHLVSLNQTYTQNLKIIWCT